MTLSPHVDLGQIITLATLICGLIGFLYVSKYRLDKVEVWQEKIEKKLDTMAKSNDEKHEAQRQAIFLMAGQVQRLVGQSEMRTRIGD